MTCNNEYHYDKIRILILRTGLESVNMVAHRKTNTDMSPVHEVIVSVTTES